MTTVYNMKIEIRAIGNLEDMCRAPLEGAVYVRNKQYRKRPTNILSPWIGGLDRVRPLLTIAIWWSSDPLFRPLDLLH